MMGKLYMHWNIGNHVVRSAIEISQLFIIYFVNFVRFEVEWIFLQNMLCKNKSFFAAVRGTILYQKKKKISVLKLRGQL